MRKTEKMSELDMEKAFETAFAPKCKDNTKNRKFMRASSKRVIDKD